VDWNQTFSRLRYYWLRIFHRVRILVSGWGRSLI
jgi:hypothetical protein